jgi:hypothetical protein
MSARRSVWSPLFYPPRQRIGPFARVGYRPIVRTPPNKHRRAGETHARSRSAVGRGRLVRRSEIGIASYPGSPESGCSKGRGAHPDHWCSRSRLPTNALATPDPDATINRLNDFIHAAWPVIAGLSAILILWATRRYLFAQSCWRCGFQLGRPSSRHKPLLGFMNRVQCRRCGAHSIRIG